MKSNKTIRYTMRLEPSMYERFKHIAAALGTSIPDLVVCSVMMTFQRATNSAEYLQAKAHFIEQNYSQLDSAHKHEDF